MEGLISEGTYNRNEISVSRRGIAPHVDRNRFFVYWCIIIKRIQNKKSKRGAYMEGGGGGLFNRMYCLVHRWMSL